MGELLILAPDLDKMILEAESLSERRNPEGLPLAEEVMRLALQTGELKYIAAANYLLAFYYCLVANDYDKAIQLCNAGLNKLNEDEGAELCYKFYMTLGNAYQLKGEVFSAQESYMKGLKQLESRKTLDKKEIGYLASFYYNASVLLNSSELEISAEEYLIKAIKIYEEIDNSFRLSKSYVAYAGIFESKGMYVEAIEILFKALKIDQRKNDLYSMALTKANLGIQLLRIHKLEEASEYLTEALQYFSANNMQYETARVKIDLGETVFASGRKKEGIRELLDAEEMFIKLDNKRELSMVHQLLANFVAEVGDFKGALHYQRKYTESLRYFFNIEKTNALTRVKKEFETEQREKETALLKEKNEEIKLYVHKLENSNNELKQFAHVASHDLREPLRMVNSYMNLLKRSLHESITPQQNEFIGFALDGSKRMEQLIMDLLRLAKVDANPHIQPVKLQSVVDEIKLNLEALMKERGAQIITTGLPEIMADRTQMLQLFQNIIGNGIKYNENATPVIRVKCVRKKDELEISISDNGIGIPQNHREKVFEIFQRLHTAREYSGTGIGLSICRKIVDSMNGKIWVEDNPEGGTTFKFVFKQTIELKPTISDLTA
ncbi:MAG: hypothetical protein JWO06_3695 [Bacteroidota bacterium]|nr:hypothetical protein [Bacteroidota bacterium]